MGPAEVRDFVNSLRSTFSSIEALSIPTIAVVEGAAFGGGLELALSAIFVFVGRTQNSACQRLPSLLFLELGEHSAFLELLEGPEQRS